MPDYILPAVKDNAEGQLNGGISASATSIVLRSGEGALFPTIYRGSATSVGDSNTLNSTGIHTSGIEVGDFIENITDGSYAYVLSIDTDTIETTALRGGSGNDWGNSDVWVVNRFVITLNSRNSSGAITAYEKVIISDISGDTLSVESVGDRGYSGTTAQSWSDDDYVSLFVIEESIEGLKDAIGHLHEYIATNTAAIATNTAAIATNTAAIATNTAAIAGLPTNYASQAEAEAGTNNTNIMTPLRTKQAVDYYRAFSDQSTAEAGVSSTVVMSPLRTEQHADNYLSARSSEATKADTDEILILRSGTNKKMTRANFVGFGNFYGAVGGVLSKTQADGLSTYNLDVAIGSSLIKYFELKYRIIANIKDATPDRIEYESGVIRGELGGSIVRHYNNYEANNDTLTNELAWYRNNNNSSQDAFVTSLPSLNPVSGGSQLLVTINSITQSSTNIRINITIGNNGASTPTNWGVDVYALEVIGFD